MTKEERETIVAESLENIEVVKLLQAQNGFTKVTVSTSLFAKRADVSCQDKVGKKRQLKAELVYVNDKT